MSQSVFRMSEDIVVSTAPYCAAQEDSGACLQALGPTHKFGWTGTAWTVENQAGRSFMMTAGHMCESNRTYSYEESDLGVDANGNLAFVTKKYDLPIVSAKYAMHGADGTDYTDARIVLDDDSIDLCELVVPGFLGRAIPLAESDPTYGDRCYYVGAPAGLWGNGVAITADASFSGRGNLWNEDHDSLFFTALAAGGASGSPIVCDGRAVAVLNEGSAGHFTGLFSGIPEDIVRGFHRRARHRKAD